MESVKTLHRSLGRFEGWTLSLALTLLAVGNASMLPGTAPLQPEDNRGVLAGAPGPNDDFQEIRIAGVVTSLDWSRSILVVESSDGRRWAVEIADSVQDVVAGDRVKLDCGLTRSGLVAYRVAKTNRVRR